MQKLIWLLLLVSTIGFSQPISIDNLTANGKDIYPWITFLTESEPVWLKMQTKDGVVSYAFRVIVTTSEIYNTVYFEKVTYGEEGCCKQVEYIVKLDMQKFANLFSLEGELSGFHFIGWQNDKSFDFEMHNQKFNIQIGKQKVIVINKSAG